ncbi:hypothetical protein SEF58_01320 [Neomoorella humiferrea]
MTLYSQQKIGASGWQVWGCWRPRHGCTVGGDFCYIGGYKENSLLVACVDVLGHGEEAYRSLERIQSVIEKGGESLVDIFHNIETTAFHLRGCALFLGKLEKRFLEYILVGNIRAWIINPGDIDCLLGQSGVVGGRRIVPALRRVQLGEQSMLLTCSDGIKRSFFPGNLPRQWWWDDGLAIICSILEEFGIGEDDASIIMGRRW